MPLAADPLYLAVHWNSSIRPGAVTEFAFIRAHKPTPVQDKQIQAGCYWKNYVQGYPGSP